MNDIKMCCKCKEKKNISKFYKDKKSEDGFRYECKSCCKLYNKPYNKQYREKNPEKIKLQKHQHYLKNKDEISLYHRQWYMGDKERILLKRKQHYLEHKEEIKIKVRQYDLKHVEEKKICAKNWYSNNKEKVIIRQRKYEKHKRETDFIFRVKKILSSRTRRALKDQSVKKSLRMIECLGCTAEFFQIYIQSHFKHGITMANKEPRKWVLHHIKYCQTFDLRDPEQQKLCFHYTNVIPMWEDEHIALHANNPV